MAFDETLADRIRDVVVGREEVGERRMFGGIAFMFGGNMGVGIVGDELMVRVGPEQYTAALAQPHAREMDFTGKPMKGMVFVTPEGIATDADLAGWVEAGADFAASLPSK